MKKKKNRLPEFQTGGAFVIAFVFISLSNKQVQE